MGLNDVTRGLRGGINKYIIRNKPQRVQAKAASFIMSRPKNPVRPPPFKKQTVQAKAASFIMSRPKNPVQPPPFKKQTVIPKLAHPVLGMAAPNWKPKPLGPSPPLRNSNSHMVAQTPTGAKT